MVSPGLITEHIMESLKLNKKYFYYYLNTNELKLVSRKAFDKGEFPVIADEKSSIKVVHLGNYAKKKLKYLLFEAANFKAEGFGRDCVDAMSFLKDIIGYLAAMKRSFEDLKRVFDANLLLKVISIIIKLQSAFTKGFIMADVIVGILDLYLLVQGFKDKFQAEMLEEVCLASISLLLPKTLFEIVKRINVFSSAKLCDDISGLHSLFTMIIEALFYILDLLPQSSIISQLRHYLEQLTSFGIHSHLYMMNKLISEDRIGEKLTKDVYRNKIKDFYAKLNHGDFKQWARRSASVAATYLDFEKLYKRVKAYEECVRQEPVGIVFQGHPGCGKSRAMNAVIESLPWSKYAHLVKDVNDGKDFYDTYENETIFYMDDVGQQGISQWRTFINMISEVKYPLDCARVENKDTKFFNSEIVMATTNEFTNLNGLLRDDCIRELPALWRRCLVLDFHNITFDGTYKGTAVWKHYNLKTKEFTVGFPLHVSQHFSNKEEVRAGKYASFQCNGNDLDFYAWICRIISELRRICRDRMVSNKLTPSQLDYIRANFEPESLPMGPRSLFSWPWSKTLNDNLSNDNESDESSESEDLDDLNIKLQRLRDEFYQEQSDGDINLLRKNNFIIFKEFMGDAISWILAKLKSMCAQILDSDVLLNLVVYIVTLALTYSVMFLVSHYFEGKKKNVVGEFVAEFDFKQHFTRDSLNTFHESVVRNLKEVTIISQGKPISIIALMSGHCALVPSHAIAGLEGNYLTVFNSRSDNHILYDKLPVEVIYLNREEDVAVLKLPKNIPTIFRKISKFFRLEESKFKLLTPFGGLDSCVPYHISSWDPVIYKIPLVDSESRVVVSGDHFKYPVRGYGLCGSLVVGNGSIQGMHVAGNEAQGIGMAIKWSEQVLCKLTDLFEADCEIIPFEISPKIMKDSSIIKVNESLNVSVGSKTNFATTPLYNLFPVTRFPADLTKYGKCTVKDIAKKSFGHTVAVPWNELEFGKKVARNILSGAQYRILKESEIVAGNSLLAGLNKQSSNGYGCKPNKTDYIDFDNGLFLPSFSKELEDFERGLRDGNVDWKKLVWTEALKDELRNVEKEGVPRSFRVGTIHHQVLMKKYFGWLVEHIMVNRQYNYIMVGMNPFAEWPKMYNELRSCKGVFAGDIAKWDGSMNNMVQDAIKDVILEFVPEQDRELLDILLQNAIRSIIAVQDDLYVTTHSMPSGHYLTAMLNSLVNRFYTAMWYEREVGDGNVNKCVHGIIDYVYGDDKLVGVKIHPEILNAKSMLKFFTSLNMGFTDSLKNDIITEFQEMSEVTFLKRFFRYHDELGRIVCPLELRTLQSGISFYDKTKDLDVVLKAKIETYQRECYLWPERDNLLLDFETHLRERGYAQYILDRSYLKSVYYNAEDVYLELNWGGTQYI